MNASLIQSMIEDRSWSWPAIGIVSILLGLALRSFLLFGILRRIKASNRKWYKRTQAYYEKRALIGWIFFGLFVSGSTMLWRFERFFLTYMDYWKWWVILLGCLMIALVLHIRAYAQSLVDAAGEQLVQDKEF